MKTIRFLATGMMTILMAASFLPSAQANPYYYGGCGGNGGWYGTGIPNGLGWTLFGISAAGVLAAVTAPFIARPVYAPPAYYYQPAPQTVVVRQSSQSFQAAPVPPPNGTLAKAQSKLMSLGYYKGGVDGSFGPMTQRAVEQFQADNNLPVSGRLDLKTLSSLGITL